LERSLGLPYVYAGQIFREQAARQGYSLQEFNELAQQDPSVDLALDDRQLELLRGGGVILEGRMAGWLAHHHAIPAFKVWVVCDEDERARRLSARDGGDPTDQRRMTRVRVAREQDRYRRYYGADLSDTSIYDLVLDSTHAAPEQLVERVLEALPAR
jgi:predicted cytidylate kinase